MADDDTRPPPRISQTSLANLKLIKKGEVRNPTGNNGRQPLAAFRQWAEQSPDGGNYSRIMNVWTRLYLTAVITREREGQKPAPPAARVAAAKIFIEQYQGAPKAAVDLSSSDGSMSPQALTTAENRALLAALLAEDDKPKKPDGPAPDAEQPVVDPK